VISAARSLVRARWGLLRLAAAAVLLWVLVTGDAARLSRLQLALLPEADYLAEARALRGRGHYAEALVVCDAGLASLSGAARLAVEEERGRIADEQAGLLRRLRDLARGAVTGAGTGIIGEDGPEPSIELLLGAIATDLFVIGDIRDLIIQGSRYARGQMTDPVLVALSGVGLVTTLAPEIDWVPSLLKAARKAGAMTESFAGFIRKAAGERRLGDLQRTMSDTADIARTASPAGALLLLKHVDSADDAAALAKFLSRSGATGAYALRSTGKAGVDLAKSAEALRAAGRVDDAVALERVLMTAGGKGHAGAAWLGRGGHRALLKPHPLLGMVKAVWKGNAQALVQRIMKTLDPTAGWAIPGLAAWVFVELALLARRFGGAGRETA
jgi:hypothetical protein